MIISLLASYLASVASLLVRRRERLPLFIFTSMIVVILLGFRSGFLTDYDNYIGAIAYMYRSEVFFGRGYDPFFDLVTWVSFKLDAPEYFVLFVYFSLTYFLLLRVLWRYSPNCAFSLLILICVAPLGASLNLTRQALAFSIVLYALCRFYKARFGVYEIVVLLISLTVHETVFLMLPLRFFARLPSNFGFWLIFILSAIPSKIIAVKVIDLLASYYSQTNLPFAYYFVNTRYLFTDRSDSGIVLYANIFIAIWVAYKLPVLRGSALYSIICKTYIVGVVATFIFMDFQLFVRLMQNYAWVAFMAWPIAMNCYRQYWLRMLSLYGLTAYCFVMLLLWFIALDTLFDGGQHAIVY